MTKEDRTQQDIARIWSKPDESDSDSKSQTSSANPLLAPDTLETFGADDEAGEPIIEKILNRQEILQIFAPSGVGKSIYTDNIIASLLAGETLFGEFIITKPHDVYLCEFEMSSYERGERLRSIAQKSSARFYAKNLMYEGYKLNNSQHYANFEEAMKRFKPSVIVIDPWKASHSVDENNSSEIEPILAKLRKLLFEINASLIIVHHAGRDFFTRDGERSPRHSRGTTVLDDRSDIIWEIEETDDQNITVLRRRKLRGFHKEMGLEYKIHYDNFSGILVVLSKRGAYADFIRRRRIEMKLTQEDLAEYFGVNVRTLRRWEAGIYNPPDEVIEKLRQT